MVKQEVYWYTKGKPEITELQKNTSADSVIVGGGMAGLMAAYRLAKTGQKVIVVEKDFCGGGATGKSSGFITPDSELEFSDLARRFGEKDAKEIWQFAVGGVEAIREVIMGEKIDCDYQIQDSLFIANRRRKYKIIEEEYGLLNENFSGNRLYEKDEMTQVIGSDRYAGALRYKDTFGINAYLFCLNLKKALERMGVGIFEHTEVTDIAQNKVTTKSGLEIETQRVLVTLDRFLPKLGIYPKEVYSTQTFLTISKILANDQVKAIFPGDKLMAWDSDLIYQYFRITGDNRLLFGASSLLYTYLPFAYKKGSTRILRKIDAYIKGRFKGLPSPIEIEYIWPGLIGITKDFLPLCGKIPDKDIYYISGAAGLPWAAACAGYIAEKIVSGKNDMDKFFTAKRKFLLGEKIQAMLSKPMTFALSHGIIKYFKK